MAKISLVYISVIYELVFNHHNQTNTYNFKQKCQKINKNLILNLSSNIGHK